MAFKSRTYEPISPSQDAVAVTPDNDNDLAFWARSLHIGTAGNVRVMPAYGEDAVTIKCPAGRLDLMVKRVYATGTTATDIVALL